MPSGTNLEEPSRPLLLSSDYDKDGKSEVKRNRAGNGISQDSHNLTLSVVGLIEDQEQQTEENQVSPGTTVGQTTFNVVKVYVGIGLLSMVYAMSKTGWMALVILGFEALMFGISGYMLIKGFDYLRVDEPNTYVNLGYSAQGYFGYIVVLLFSFLEFFGALCMTLLVLCKEFEELMGAVKMVGKLDTKHFSEIVNIVIVMIFGMSASYQRLSFTSLLGTLCTIVVVVAVFVAVLYDPFKQKLIQQGRGGEYSWFQLQGAPLSIGLFALSLSGHSALPVLRNSMEDTNKFPLVLLLSFLFMFLLYGIMAVVGYYYFGSSASVLITTDLSQAPLYVGHNIFIKGFTIDDLIKFLIWLNALTTYPLILLSIQDMIMSYFGSRPVAKCTKLWLRMTIFLGSVIVCVGLYDVFGYFESLSGGFSSMICSLLLPTLFYASLWWGVLKLWQKVLILSMFCIGTVIVIIVTFKSFVDLIEHFT